MKTQENMSMSEMINFDREVVNYINDNLEYIKENARACGNNDLAKESLEHYNLTIEASNDDESVLSPEQEERFYNVAKRLFNQGYVEHAGILNTEATEIYNLSALPSGHGHYKLEVELKSGEKYRAVTSNMPLIDRYKDGEEDARIELIEFVLDENGVKYGEIEII